MTINTSICARYRYVEDWHIFDSDDLPGLYVASRDAARAFNNVGTVIEGLLRLDHGVDIKVAPEVPLKDFLAGIQHEAPMDAPLVMSDRRFVVSGAAA